MTAGSEEAVYRFIRHSLSRDEAKQYCSNLDRRLVTVDSQEKNNLIVSIRNSLF